MPGSVREEREPSELSFVEEDDELESSEDDALPDGGASSAPASVREVGRFVLHMDASAVGKRADVAVADLLISRGRATSRSSVQRLFATGNVKRGGVAIRGAQRFDAPCDLEVEIATAPLFARAFAEDLALEVVYEDEALLVVNKPAGMPVHVGPGHDRGTLVNAVLHHLGVSAEALPVLPGNDALRPGLVHRIDMGTSGLMVLAKQARVALSLADLFKRHDLARSYLAFVGGQATWQRKELRTLHGRDPQHRRRFTTQVEDGREAVTNFEVLEEYPGALFLRATLHTGRTHQIRVHARAMGMPLMGDRVYGVRMRTPELIALDETLTRPALHAHVLGFRHPLSGEQMRWECALPGDLMVLKAQLEQLRSAADLAHPMRAVARPKLNVDGSSHPSSGATRPKP